MALERDHQEVLSPKIKRALLMNVLPSSVQTRVMEHLDRLKTYKEVRDKVVSLCHITDDADIGNIDDANSPPQISGRAGGKMRTLDGMSRKLSLQLARTSKAWRTCAATCAAE